MQVVQELIEMRILSASLTEFLSFGFSLHCAVGKMTRYSLQNLNETRPGYSTRKIGVDRYIIIIYNQCILIYHTYQWKVDRTMKKIVYNDCPLLPRFLEVAFVPERTNQWPNNFLICNHRSARTLPTTRSMSKALICGLIQAGIGIVSVLTDPGSQSQPARVKAAPGFWEFTHTPQVTSLVSVKVKKTASQDWPSANGSWYGG